MPSPPSGGRGTPKKVGFAAPPAGRGRGGVIKSFADTKNLPKVKTGAASPYVTGFGSKPTSGYIPMSGRAAESVRMNPMKSSPVSGMGGAESEIYTNTNLRDATGEITPSKRMNRPKTMAISKDKPKPIGFVAWGHYLAMLSGVGLVIFGAISYQWSESIKFTEVAQYGSFEFGSLSMMLGALVFAYEYIRGDIAPPNRVGFGKGFDIRGIVYIVSSFVGFLSVPTMMPAIGLLVSGFAFLQGSRSKEANEKKVVRKKKKDPDFDDSKTFQELGAVGYASYQFRRMREEGRTGEVSLYKWHCLYCKHFKAVKNKN